MATSYFSRTPASAGNRKTFTISFWQKRSKISYNYDMMIGTAYSAGAGNSLQIFFDNTDKLIIQPGDGSWALHTTQVFRDVSAWYHIVVAVDTTQATESNRVKLYVNGSQVTSFSTATYMSQNLDTAWNNTIVQKVGDFGLNYLEGYLTNVINVDGTALTPSSFGETDATTGIWKPKLYTGSYGTNGFFLKFENSGSLGTDSSGNGNNFTVNGTPTQTVDTPSNVFCTLNPLIYISDVPTFSLGNLRAVSSTANWRQSGSTLGISTGKWYWEAKGVSGADWNGGIGIKKSSIANESTNYNYPTGYNDGAYGYFKGGNEYYNGSSSSSGITSYVVTDVVGIALDLTNNFIYYHKNGTWQNSGVPTSGATGTGGRAVTSGETWLPFVTTHAGGFDMNFGNGYFGSTAISSPVSDGAGLGKFQYTVPTGYYALCTKNINSQG